MKPETADQSEALLTTSPAPRAKADDADVGPPLADVVPPKPDAATEPAPAAPESSVEGSPDAPAPPADAETDPPAEPEAEAGADEATEAALPAPSEPAEPTFWDRSWHMWALLALTLIGGMIRFFRLDQPTLWGDEVSTYKRVNGTFDQLMGLLQEQGFVPLHYILYWLLGHVTQLTPFMMRLIPATAGTLFIPAIYYLARQFTTRKAALTAALFATFSSYALIYSRDAKMYMHTWLFGTMSVALLLHWVRTQRAAAWRGWVVFGALAAMTHVTAIMLVGLAPLAVLTTRRRLRSPTPDLLIAGLVLILAGPAWYYLVYNSYIARTGVVTVPTASDESEQSRWGNSGLTWIQRYNRDVSATELAFNSATNYLLGMQWPRETVDPPNYTGKEAPAWAAPVISTAMTIILGLLFLGLLPWPARWRGMPPALSPPREARKDPPPMSEAGETDRPTSDEAPAADDAPRTPLWDRYSGSPQPWWRSLLWLSAWIILPTYGFFYCKSFEDFQPPAALLGHVWNIAGWGWLLILPAAGAVTVAMERNKWARRAVWGVFGLILAITIPIGIANAGSRWPIGWAAALNAVYLDHLLLILLLPMLWRGAGQTTGQRLRKLLVVAAVAASVMVVCYATYFGWSMQQAGNPDKPWPSIWMPRYLGIIFPAICVVVGILLMRLPTRPVRIAAISIILALNMTQASARIFAHTEPPFDRVAHDIWEHREQTGDTRLLVNFQRGRHGWYGHWAFGAIINYYLYQESGILHSPHDFERGKIQNEVKVIPTRRSYYIQRELKNAPEPVQRLIVWDKFSYTVTPEDAAENQTVITPINAEGTWQLTEETNYPVRHFWTWRPSDWLRRRVYIHVEPEPEAVPAPASPAPAPPS